MICSLVNCVFCERKRNAYVSHTSYITLLSAIWIPSPNQGVPRGGNLRLPKLFFSCILFFGVTEHSYMVNVGGGERGRK